MNKEITVKKKIYFEKTACHVSRVTIIWNAILTVFKLLAGIYANSNAILSDAVHSASDVLSTFVVIIGVKLAAKESDKEHPYGHERMECVAAILLSVVLLGTGLLIGTDAFFGIVNGSYKNIEIPGSMALYAAIVSILVKEAMFRYTKKYAKLLDSGALMADAWHHRSDALSSIGALIGIAGARMGFPVMDPLASLIIFGFIVKAAYDIFMDAVDKMVDHACDEDMEQKIYHCILLHEEVQTIDRLKTRVFGNRIYVDIEIAVDGSYTLEKAHRIAQEIHDDIENKFEKVKHIMVHVNPV